MSKRPAPAANPASVPTMGTIDLDTLLDRLERVRRRPAGAMARCPAHDDRNPSLSINVVDGKVLWKCHAGCSQDEVTEALRALGAIPPPEYSPPPAWLTMKIAKRLRRTKPGKPPPTRAGRNLPNVIWQAGEPMTAGPGIAHHHDRGVHTDPAHPEVRWLERDAALTLIWKPDTGAVRRPIRGCRPPIPDGDDIAGLILYRFSPGSHEP